MGRWGYPVTHPRYYDPTSLHPGALLSYQGYPCASGLSRAYLVQQNTVDGIHYRRSRSLSTFCVRMLCWQCCWPARMDHTVNTRVCAIPHGTIRFLAAANPLAQNHEPWKCALFTLPTLQRLAFNIGMLITKELCYIQCMCMGDKLCRKAHSRNENQLQDTPFCKFSHPKRATLLVGQHVPNRILAHSTTPRAWGNPISTQQHV